jgi:hypothetical protein
VSGALRRLAGVMAAGLVAACVLASPDASLTQSSDAGACPAGKKSCGDACVAVDDPRFGCGEDTCTPCSLPGTAAVCRNGACTGTSEMGAWLAAHTGGWCLDRYLRFLSYCVDPSACNTTTVNDECFCFDPFWMRKYPDGIAIDLGFFWDGRSGGTLFDAGGDCDGNRIGIGLDTSTLGLLVANGPKPLRSLMGTITPGRHLVSAYFRPDRYVLYVDGVEVDASGGPGVPIELVAKCGPGVVTGARLAFWWEEPSVPRWLRAGIFFTHVRDAIDPARFRMDEATKRGPRTMVLFEGAPTGATWVDGTRVAYPTEGAAWADPLEGCLRVSP